MKVKYTTGKFQVEAEGSTTEIFKQLAAFDSVFGNGTTLMPREIHQHHDLKKNLKQSLA